MNKSEYIRALVRPHNDRSRGIGGIKGRILGSTSRRVVDSRKTPVLIIK